MLLHTFTVFCFCLICFWFCTCFFTIALRSFTLCKRVYVCVCVSVYVYVSTSLCGVCVCVSVAVCVSGWTFLRSAFGIHFSTFAVCFVACVLLVFAFHFFAVF